MRWSVGKEINNQVFWKLLKCIHSNTQGRKCKVKKCVKCVEWCCVRRYIYSCFFGGLIAMERITCLVYAGWLAVCGGFSVYIGRQINGYLWWSGSCGERKPATKWRVVSLSVLGNCMWRLSAGRHIGTCVWWIQRYRRRKQYLYERQGLCGVSTICILWFGGKWRQLSTFYHISWGVERQISDYQVTKVWQVPVNPGFKLSKGKLIYTNQTQTPIHETHSQQTKWTDTVALKLKIDA